MKPEENKAKMKVNLGCGMSKESGWIGLDKMQFGNVVDQVMDLDQPDLQLPFGTDTIDEIKAHHFLEHIHHIFPLMNECHRILKKDGLMDIIVPLGYMAAFGDPSHVRAFSEESFHYFTAKPPGNYINPEVKGKWKILLNDWTRAETDDTEKIVIHKRRELHVVLQPLKEQEEKSI